MTFRSLRWSALVAAIAAPIFLHGQETTASEDERIEQLVRSEASEWYTPKDSFRVGFRILSSGVNVRFGKLGSVAPSSVPAVAAAGDRITRVYDNGFVNADDYRADEYNDAGSVISTPGGRYTPASGVNSLSYTPGLSRVWSYSLPSQAVTDSAGNNYVAMSTYSASSDGAALAKKQGPSVGVELEFSHAFRKLGKRTELGFTGGLAINGINNKSAGDIHATLHTSTDYYLIPAGYTVPTTSLDKPYSTITPTYSDDGKTETTVPISGVPSVEKHTDTPTTGAALVHGLWQVRGTYMVVRLGPSLRTQLTNSFAVSGSAGVAGAYVGTHYSAFESLEIPGMNKTVADVTTGSDENKFLAGYYGDFNLEWNPNEVVGLYGGLSAQKFGAYTQDMGDRNARIDLGASLGLRGGLNIKF